MDKETRRRGKREGVRRYVVGKSEGDRHQESICLRNLAGVKKRAENLTSSSVHREALADMMGASPLFTADGDGGIFVFCSGVDTAAIIEM